jgi:DNA-binding transcriptional regulator LsrR (DeoR family)
VHGRLDDAARAGWLYYVAGRTQDEIAAAMGISRQSAQRLVSLAVAERLIKVRLDHPIAACLERGEALKRRFGLRQVEVVPSDPMGSSTTVGIAEAGAAEIERWLKRQEPIVLAIGTGRTLKAAVDQLPPMDCPQHRIVSLTGNIGPDGSAAYYNVIFSMADAIKSRHFPMPLPVLCSSPEERETLHEQALVRSTLALGAQAGRHLRRHWRTWPGGAALHRRVPRAGGNGEPRRGRSRRGNMRLDVRSRRPASIRLDQ